MAGLLVLIIAISAPFAQLSDAEKLTAIAAPSFSEHESTQRRFVFLVKEFNKYCPAEPSGASTADMLVFSHGKLKDAGLDSEENLLELANTLHRMTAEIAAAAISRNSDLTKCSEIWTTYLTLRLRGQPPTEAREGVTGVVRRFYGPKDFEKP